MSRNLNRWVGIGRIGQDLVMKYMPDQTEVINTSIACGDDYKKKDTSEKVERTDWVNLTFTGVQAKILNEYCRKGSKIYVEGKLKNRKYTDNSGVEKYITEIKVSSFEMLDSKHDGGQQQGYQSAPANNTPNFDDNSDLPF